MTIKEMNELKAREIETGIYNFDGLAGTASGNALNNVITIINRIFGSDMLTRRDWEKVEQITKEFGIKFDVDGNIITKN